MPEACNPGAAFYAAMSVTRADGASERRDLASCGMSKSELEQRAEHHAQEAERLLADRLGLINRTIKAGVHATLAVYYAAQAQRVDVN
jgi:hypothetical protein